MTGKADLEGVESRMDARFAALRADARRAMPSRTGAAAAAAAILKSVG